MSDPQTTELAPGTRFNMLREGITFTPETMAAAKERYEKQKAAEHQQRAATLLDESDIPRRHRLKTNLSTENEWGKSFKKIEAMLGTGFLVALVGGRGPGKTQLAVELIRHNIESKLRRSKYLTATGFFMLVKAGYSDDRAELETLKELRAPKLLVIDEMGYRCESDWENRLLYELINSRYNDLTDTLLISNHEVQEFENSIGASLCSRMRESGGIIRCDWQSFRK